MGGNSHPERVHRRRTKRRPADAVENHGRLRLEEQFQRHRTGYRGLYDYNGKGKSSNISGFPLALNRGLQHFETYTMVKWPDGRLPDPKPGKPVVEPDDAEGDDAEGEEEGTGDAAGDLGGGGNASADRDGPDEDAMDSHNEEAL